MKELARFLLQHVTLDFSGDVTIDQVRQFLRADDSKAARALMGKVIEEKGVDDLLLTLADCLTPLIGSGITEETVADQLSEYADS